MKQSLVPLCVVSTLLLLAGCSKEGPGSPSQVASSSTMEEFDPPAERIAGLIEDFQHLKERYHSRDAEELGERPLTDAVWTSEADANYMKGDASVNTGFYKQDSVEFTLPVHQKEDGSLWVHNADLIAKQEELINTINGSTHGAKVFWASVELGGTSGENASLKAEWIKMESVGEDRDVIGGPPDPGCWNALVGDGGSWPINDASDVMQRKMGQIHELETGTYITSLTKPTIISDNSIYSYVGGYAMYAGSRADLGGPALIFNGPNGTDQLCFPGYWNKYLALKTRFSPASFTEPGRKIVWESWSGVYSPLVGTPMSYGSPYYPMGAYHHTWVWRSGIIQHHVGPEPE